MHSRTEESSNLVKEPLGKAWLYFHWTAYPGVQSSRTELFCDRVLFLSFFVCLWISFFVCLWKSTPRRLISGQSLDGRCRRRPWSCRDWQNMWSNCTLRSLHTRMQHKYNWYTRMLRLLTIYSGTICAKIILPCLALVAKSSIFRASSTVNCWVGRSELGGWALPARCRPRSSSNSELENSGGGSSSREFEQVHGIETAGGLETVAVWWVDRFAWLAEASELRRRWLAEASELCRRSRDLCSNSSRSLLTKHSILWVLFCERPCPVDSSVSSIISSISSFSLFPSINFSSRPKWMFVIVARLCSWASVTAMRAASCRCRIIMTIMHIANTTTTNMTAYQSPVAISSIVRLLGMRSSILRSIFPTAEMHFGHELVLDYFGLNCLDCEISYRTVLSSSYRPQIMFKMGPTYLVRLRPI